MHPQLDEIARDLKAAGERLHRLADAVPAVRWTDRPAPESWSVAECVAHLNLTSEQMMPPIREGLDRARALGGSPPARMRRGFLGWLLWRASGPTGRMRVKTSAPFIPQALKPAEDLLAEYDRWQEAQLAAVRAADGLPLHRVKIGSPFNARVRYNLFAALSILPGHAHRHLGQAERAWDTLRAGAG